MKSDEPQHRPGGPFARGVDLESQITRVTPSSGPAVASPYSSEDRIFPTGARIADRYRINDILGVGGMGVVYRAYDEMLELELALKVLRPEVARDGDFVQRFRNELVLARKVSHPHVVSNYDVGVHQGFHFMTMDLVVGRSLEEILREKGKLPLDEAVGIVRNVASALAEAHRQNIVHRDLKPANILLDKSGKAYVTDFGIARSISSGLTRTGEILGTPDYLSPEQARGEKVDGRSDIFTLGLILIQLLTGKLPFPGGTLLEVVAQRMSGKVQSLEEVGLAAPPHVTRVIEKCLEKNPVKRYQNADEILRDLESPAGAGGKSATRTLALASALVIVGLGAFLLGRQNHPAPVDSTLIAPPPPTGAAATATPVRLPTPEPRHSVAILPFPETEGSAQLAWAANGVAEMLATSLAENEDLRVVESVQVFQVLEDLGFRSQPFRDSDLEQLAELLRVDRLVFGALKAAAGQIQLEMSLMEADLPGAPSRRIASQQGTLRELFDLVDRLAASLVETLDIEAPRSAPEALTPSATAMRAYTEGLEYLSRRDTLKAAPALEQAVAEDPSFATAWVRLSQTYQSLGRDDDAVAAARQGARAASERRGRIVYEAQAQDALVRGQPEEAQRYLEELVGNYPNDTRARVALAEAYGQQGNFARALSQLQEAVGVDSGAQAWYLLGRFSIEAGDSKRAVDEYLVEALAQQKKVRNEQGEAEVYNALGVGYERLGDFGLAAENYTRASDIHRRVGDARGIATSLHNLAVTYYLQGYAEPAIENIETALELYKELGDQSGLAELNNLYGAVEEERGRYPKALEYYRLAFQERKNQGDERALAESHGNIGFIYYLLGEYDNALLYLENALDFFRKNEDQRGIMLTAQSIGFCELALGKWREAVRSFLDSLDLSRQLEEKMATAVSLGNLGTIAHYQGRYKAAFSSYSEALEIITELEDPRGQVEFTLHESEALLELGELTRAEAKLQHVEGWEVWREGGGNREQRAGLLTLQGQAALQNGALPKAEIFLAEASREAVASQSAVAQVKVKLVSGLIALERKDLQRALEELRPAAAEATRLGNAILRLRIAEALARAELAAGNLGGTDDLLREALRLSEDGGTYGRSYRLHHLHSQVLSQKGDAQAAGQSLEQARQDLARLRQDLGDDQRRSFDQLAHVRELLSP